MIKICADIVTEINTKTLTNTSLEFFINNTILLKASLTIAHCLAPRLNALELGLLSNLVCLLLAQSLFHT